MKENSLKPFVTSHLFLALVLCLTTGLFSPARAQSPMSEYQHDVWDSDSGLPTNTITKIVQGDDGYLWIATSEGLARFDGARFVVFDRWNTPAINDNAVTSLYTDREGILWIGTFGGGISRYKDGNFYADYTLLEGLSSSPIGPIYKDSRDTLWVATYTGGLYRRGEGGVFSLYELWKGMPGNRIRSLAGDRKGALWVGTPNGLYSVTDGGITLHTVKNGLPNNSVQAIHEDREGNLWVGTDGGLSRFRDGKFTTFTTRDGLCHNFVRSLHEDREGNIWIGTATGVSRLREGKFTAYTSKDGLSNDYARTLCEDREGSLWIGTNVGLNRLRKAKFTVYTTKDGLSTDLISTIYEDKEGNLWVGTDGGGLNRLRDGKFTSYTTRNGLSNHYIRSLYEDREGNLWVGTDGGLNRFRDGKFKVYTTKDGLSTNAAGAVYQDRKGDLWVGTGGGGLNRFRDGKFTAYTTRDGLSKNNIGPIYEDREGNLWVGTDGGLNRFRDGVFTVYTTKDGLSHDVVYSIYEDQEGDLWIGTGGGGLNRFRDGKFTAFTTKDGLFDNTAYRILEDARGNLWMSSNKGIFHVPKRQLHDFADGKIAVINCSHYGKSDGLKSSQCSGGMQPAGYRTRDGKLWFPTMKGMAVIDPGRLRINEVQPPVIIEQTLAGKRVILQRGGAQLSPGESELEFHYTALSLVSPEKVKFKYRLEGFDKGWIDADTRRVAYYTNLPPGNYVFRVIASNNDGVWNRSGAMLEFTLPPRFHQTYWFYITIVVASTLLGLWFYRLRVAYLVCRNKQLESYVAARTSELRRTNLDLEKATRAKSEFLANMSHEIRTPMNAVIGMTELLMTTPLSVDQRECVETIHSSSDVLLEIIDEILDLSKIESGMLEIEQTPFDLRACVGEVLKLFAARAAAKGLIFTSDVGETVPAQIIGDGKRLRQILINLIGNAIKFTNSGEVSLVVSAQESAGRHFELRFVVNDTGIGIPADKVDRLFKPFSQINTSTTRQYGGTGLGLVICKRLSEMMGGRIWVKSEEGKGSSFYFSILTRSAKAHSGARLQTAGHRPGANRPYEAGQIDCQLGRHMPVRILLAEDNVVNQRVVLRMLNRMGYQADVVANGKEALDAVMREKYDLVLMDLHMPIMDGLETTRQIRSRIQDRGPHIIALTANAMRGEKDRCLEAGMDDYLSKPVRSEWLYDALIKAGDRMADPAGEVRPLEPAAIDLEILRDLERMGGDAETHIIEELFALFRIEAPKRLASIGRALASDDDEGLRREAHALKGSCADLGARRMVSLCEEIEKTGDGKGKPLLAKLEDEYRQVCAVIERLASGKTFKGSE